MSNNDQGSYDTREGIQNLLSTLQGLNELTAARCTAGYDHGERMQEWYILGRWFLDTCGNTCRFIGDFIPGKVYPDIPAVLTREELWAFLESKGLDASEVSTCASYSSGIPPAGTVCSECAQPWTIDDCHDAVVVREIEVIPLDEFVGKTLEEVQSSFRLRINAAYRMQSDILIRNDRFIDLTPRPEYETLVVNENGWVGKRDGIDSAYTIQPGDEGYFNVWRFYHPNCQRQRLAREEEQYFRQMFAEAGYEVVCVIEIPNQYCSCEHCAPWFMVTTTLGTFTIGWRKRVINIDWSTTGENFLPLFKEEDVTKGSSHIHAWGTEKATEYLTKIRQALEEG